VGRPPACCARPLTACMRSAEPPVVKLAAKVAAEYAKLIAERQLPHPLVLDALVLAQGSIWCARAVRARAPPAGAGGRKPPPPPRAPDVLLLHALALHRTLWEIGAAQVAEGAAAVGVTRADVNNAEADAKDPLALAEKITAVFRRTLEAQRVAAKWVRATLKYLRQAQTALARGDRVVHDGPALAPGTRVALAAEFARFWAALAQFATALTRAFPAESLPRLAAPLAEDTELRGFLPLRRLLLEDALAKPETDGEAAVPAPADAGGAHPNEEHLMRIRDVLEDVAEIAALEVGSYRLSNDVADRTSRALRSRSSMACTCTSRSLRTPKRPRPRRITSTKTSRPT
jgi:protein SMG7